MAIWQRIWSSEVRAATKPRTETRSKTERTANKHEKNPQESLLTLLILTLFITSVLVKIGGHLWIKKRLRDIDVRVSLDEYTYTGNDYPQLWPIERGNVLMAFGNPKYAYALDTRQGALEWASLIPSAKGWVIHLGPSKQPYTISMFHQLKCLDIVRNATVRDKHVAFGSVGGDGGKEEREWELARHCLNYLRQMVMCRGDLELESFQFASNKNPIDLHGIYECKDWTKVYEGVERNWKEFEGWDG